ncbi:MAG: DinB family protein [Gemmatimonadaceae bacterium]|nr:DinB family protein [Gemmatimonadaceae bacterium]
MVISAPDRTEFADYYLTYVEKVAGNDVMQLLEAQLSEVLPILAGVSEERSLHRYAPDKWSIRQVVSHMNDTERLFSFRAFWFARGLTDPLPSFDQDDAVAVAGAEDRSWSSHLEELEAVRGATLTLFRNLPEEAWMRRGVASGNPFTVRALAYICAGHVAHHVTVLQERYLTS